MIRITKNTEHFLTFEKDTWEESWFGGDISRSNLLKQCNREGDEIKIVHFTDGKYIGSVINIYFETKKK